MPKRNVIKLDLANVNEWTIGDSHKTLCSLIMFNVFNLNIKLACCLL